MSRPTRYPHRITAVVPAARKPALVAWMAANLGPEWAGAFSAPLIPLAAADTATPTHYWSSFCCTDTQAKNLMIRITGQTSLMQPGAWDAWNRTQKKAWLAAVRVSVRNAIGAEIIGSDNDGTWDAPANALTALGLKTPRPALPGAA